jgi:copper chaperone NosL
MNKISPFNRIALAAASLLLILTYFLPVWEITLFAPQYPEGLSMQIWLNQLTGQVEIINGLNHYIGMKHIKVEMFPEFTYLVYVVGAFIVLGLLVAAWGRLKALVAYVVMLVAGGVAAMVDFWTWGYDYGHNLDPTAAIRVPGLSYQPPLIGHKKLLNFDAYSYPDSGGWVIVVAGLIFIAVLILEWRRGKQLKKSPMHKGTLTSTKSLAALLMLAFVLPACQSGPQPFAIGKDGCHFCKMTLMTTQFGGEVITKKGKVFKFDDLHCVKGFLKSNTVPEADIADILTTDYTNKDQFIPVEQAHFVQGGALRSPMGSNTAGFATKEAAEAAVTQSGGKAIDWNNL